MGQSPSGLWYTCVHAKQLLIDPMCICEWKKIIKYSLFLRQCKVYQPARSQRKKGVKKKKKKKKFGFLTKMSNIKYYDDLILFVPLLSNIGLKPYQ